MSLPVSKVEIRLACTELPNLDVMSKTDCCIMVYQVQSFSQPPTAGSFIGKTEIIDDSLNPVFSTPILMDYLFETDQKLRFLVVDIDSKRKVMNLDKQDIIGVVETSLGNLISASGPGRTVIKPIVNEKEKHNHKFKDARLKLSIEQAADSKSAIKFSLAATVPKKGLLRRPDPFFRVFRPKEDGQEVAVYTSSVRNNCTDPTWLNIQLTIQSLCNGDKDRSLTFKFFDWEKDGEHDYICEFQASLNEFAPDKAFGMFKHVKGSKEKAGIVKLVDFKVETVHTFVDYIQGGCQINLNAAIDFTGSNGDPRLPTSLHHRNPNALNSYQEAILSVGTILQEYDSDKLFPAFGFGAKLPTGEVSHCWPINGNYEHPECAGIQGILDAYSLALSNCSLHGPTNFSPVINARCDFVEQEMKMRQANHTPWVFHVLLIITDGEITDIDSTVRAVVRASFLPMAVIIVGVGTGCSFEAMKVLDGDNNVLVDDSGKRAEGDVVQFVAMKDINMAGYDRQAELARQLLAELPDQIVGFFKKRGITPDKLNN